MINQTRARIDDSTEAGWANDYSYTNKTYVLPGGRICRFTPSVMVEMRMVKEVKPIAPDATPGKGPEKDEFVVEPATPETDGKPCVNRIRVRTLKNKVTGAGFREGYIWVRPATSRCPGIDEWMSVRELAREHGLIQNKGAKWFVGEDSDHAVATYPNKEAAVEDLVVKQNPDVLKKLRALVIEAVKADNSGRYAAAVDAEEIKYMEGDEEHTAVGKGFDVEEA